MKIIRWIADNIFFVFSLLLLAFIPLYPKLPLIDIRNTWVYVRAEDFVVIFVILVWIAFLLSKKINLRTPLTLPILLFWIFGAISTIHGVLLIFPGLANVFPNVAFLSFLRRVEYISLFFIAFAGMKNKQFLRYVIVTLIVSLIAIIVYGLGQRGNLVGWDNRFPAFLTMNEEFAKGEPILLSEQSRVPSTFGGHYDFAAYLVLVVPILASLFFGFRNRVLKIFLICVIGLGFYLMYLTESRISFVALLISIAIVLFYQKKKIILLSLPLGVILLIYLFLGSSTILSDRFESTIKEIDVLVDVNTGEAIGHPIMAERKELAGKIIMQDYDIVKQNLLVASGSARNATDSGNVNYTKLPENVLLLKPPDAPTGEDLPQGTGYINLLLSPVTKQMGEYFYENKKTEYDSSSADIIIIHGKYLIKRVSTYDLSFTTRFQGEWPNALVAFKRNILFGSGFGSVSLAVDNNYLRLLGETGLLGFISFIAIFIALGIYMRQVLPHVDSLITRSFVSGLAAGIVGLGLNAVFIDVFEASKVAFVLWILVGVTVGVLNLYQTKIINMYIELKKAVTSSYAVISYLLVICVILFSPMVNNYFVGDDFTWLRWAADCNGGITSMSGCPPVGTTITQYFTDAQGFFYRPATKLYFLLMYNIFWLNQTVYHSVSILLHFVVSVLFFLLAKKILRDNLLSAIGAGIFLLLSSFVESVFWIAATGYLFNAAFMLLSLFFYILWDEKKRAMYFAISISAFVASLLFHEIGIVTPILILLYKITQSLNYKIEIIEKKVNYILLFIPIVPYLGMRMLAQSHWLSGDYNYNLLKLPFNAVGNSLGYFLLTLFGPIILPFYQTLRSYSREHLLLAIAVIIVLIIILSLAYKQIIKRLERSDKRIIVFGILFFIIALLPFIGLGNITSRYSYLASIGVIILFVFFLKKLYIYLLGSGRDIALAVVILVVSFFGLLHIVQLQQIHSDWYEAGEKAKRFFIAIDGSYADYWTKEPMEFHFVNVPIKHGEAWIFPVGLSDALWLVFRNPKIEVNQSSSVEEAMKMIEGTANEKVFEFDESGKVLEIRNGLDIQ